MDAMLFFEEFIRMITDGNEEEETLTSFRLSVKMKHKILGEREFYFLPDKDTVSAVHDWSRKHPRKTRANDFREKHPNAKIESNFYTEFCCETLGYCEKCDHNYNASYCKDCWSESI